MELTKKFELSEAQAFAYEKFNDPQITELLFGGSAGPQPLDSKIMTPFGQKNMKNVQVGDKVLTDTGIATVIDIPYEGIRDVYQITFSDGSKTRASDNHLWKTKIARGRKRNYLDDWQIRTTSQVKQLIDKGKHVVIPLAKPAKFTKPYNGNKIDPYVLGCILGNGSISQKGISFTTADKQIVDEIEERITGSLTKIKSKYSYYFKDCFYENKIIDKLRLRGTASHTKFIPEQYKYLPINQRWELLQGLMDTDGTVNKEGNISYSSMSKQLAIDIQWLVRSLGGNATISKNYSNHLGEKRKYYSVYIQHENKEKFFKLERKKNRVKPYNGGFGKSSKRIVDIKKIGPLPVKCISISDLSGLYLTDDFIVTHNSSKSMLVCVIAVLECAKYPGIAIGIGRKELKRLKQTTITTLLFKAHPLLGVEKSEFRYDKSEGYIQYKNGSKIIFLDMAPAPSDPDFDKFGGLELTHVFIEEGGELLKKGYDVINSRKNRMLNKEYKIVGKTIMTTNPSQNFIRTEFYDPYNKSGGGQYQQWQHGNVEIAGRGTLPAYRAFVRSTVLENPFVDENYVNTLKQLPHQERKRLFEGNWDYADQDDSLFRSILLDKATAYSLPEESEKFEKFIGVDVADKGKDKTVATLINNGVIVTQKYFELTEQQKKSDLPLSLILADKLIEFAQQNGFTTKTSKNIAIEGNGVGVGMRDSLRQRGWPPVLYEANSSSRSEGFYNFSQDMDCGAIKIINGLDDGELRKQLLAHTYEMVDQKPRVIQKSKLKEVLGHSPDEADSAMIANFIRRGGDTQNNPKKNTRRIVW